LELGKIQKLKALGFLNKINKKKLFSQEETISLKAIDLDFFSAFVKKIQLLDCETCIFVIGYIFN